MALRHSLPKSLTLGVLSLAITAALTATVVAQPADAPGSQEPPSFVTITNLSDGPFQYQVRRAIGVAWTDTITLAPNESDEYETQAVAERTEFATIGLNDRPGVIFVQYSQPPGFMRLRLNAGNNFWYAIDANGRPRLYEAQTRDLALRLKEELDNLPGEDAEALRHVIMQLEANHVLYLPRGVEVEVRSGRVDTGD